ncbi:hypothetical protein RHSIM_Rhsim06G0090200 [Rhododendron simsii]|uniref:Uncharacterized protein n=1 Tax=Rhododendron simsii TaxID=118357 RepID=A0A834GWS0_RHOSS|nr:hypothetical protein RHSIM_Rhsim06G0090200 [Rhododendron simsii]
MADGTVSFADGLGCKALDSNELRRKHQISDLAKASQPQLIQSELGTSRLILSDDTNLGPILRSAAPTPSAADFEVLSPKSVKNQSPTQKLQQVFEEALQREAEEQRGARLHVNRAQENQRAINASESNQASPVAFQTLKPFDRNSVRNIGGSAALDVVTIPVVAVVENSIPKVMEGVINESESVGDELNVNTDIPLEVKVAGVALSSNVEVDSGSSPHEPNPVATVVLPPHPVLIVKPVPPDDKAEAVKGKLAF